MQPAKLPPNEAKRIQALHECELLDTPPEQLFDSITDALADLFDMPISLVCLVDKERVWLKSSSGIEAVSEIHRDIGFCPHAINQREIFEVRDASLDTRFKDSPLVAESPSFRYYAGAPLVTHDGFALGTLCVMDYKPRELNSKQRRQLKQLAATTIALIEAKRQFNIHKATREYQLGSAIEMSPNEVYLVDKPSGKIKFANRTALLNLSATQGTLNKLHWSEVLVQSPKDTIENYLTTDKSYFTSSINFTGKNRRSDGSSYPVDCQIHSTDIDSHSFLIICSDITQRVYAENREKFLKNSIAHMDRIHTAGMLSAGLAHELNQPLTAITQYCDTALSILKKNDSGISILHEALQKATSQALRAGEIVKRYRTFTQKQLPTRTLVNIKQLIDETIRLLHFDLNKHDIKINIEVNKNLPMVNIDAIQIQQVVLNLAKNSIEALIDKVDPKITIECYTNRKNEMQFSITDNGCGIHQEVFKNTLTPIHSSKPNGTGLGLNICHFIIHSHAGKIWHDTEHTEGTRIAFTIPIVFQANNTDNTSEGDMGSRNFNLSQSEQIE